MRGECKTSLHDYFTKPQSFYAKSVELEVIFNRCWVFRDAKCGICKPKFKGQGTGPCPASSFFVTFEIIFLNIPAGQ